MNGIEIPYKQDIVINGDNGVVTINLCENSELRESSNKIETKTKKADISANIIIFCNGIEYKETVNLSFKQMKRLQDGLRDKALLTGSIVFDLKGDINIKIQHPYIDAPDNYVLTKQSQDSVSSFELIKFYETRLKILEKESCQEYLITMDNMGPCYRPTFLMKIDVVKKELDKIHCLNSEEDTREEKCYTWRLSELKNYYTIKYLYQTEAPVCSKNQIAYSGMLIDKNDHSYYKHENEDLKFDDDYAIGKPEQRIAGRLDIDEMYTFLKSCGVYTVLTKKHKDDVVAILQKRGSNINIKFIHSYAREDKLTDTPTPDYKMGCPKMSKLKSSGGGKDQYICDIYSYYNYCYLLELPFPVPDGIYKHKWSYNSILIKNNKLYIDFEMTSHHLTFNTNNGTSMNKKHLFEHGRFENSKSINYYYFKFEFDLE